MLSLPINKRLASVYFSNNKAFDKRLEYSIQFKLTDDSLDSLIAAIMNLFFVNS